MTPRSILAPIHLILVIGLLLSACATSSTPKPSTNTAAPPVAPTMRPTQPVAATLPKPTATTSPKPADWPRVVSHLPQESTITDFLPDIAFVFDQAMDVNSLSRAFHIQPDIHYRLQLDGTRLHVLPDKPLTPGTDYRFEIDTTAHSLAGLSLRNNYVWMFQVAPVINKLAGPKADQPEPKVDFSFNYALNPDSFEKSVEFSPKLTGQWGWNAARTEAVLTLGDYYEPDTAYTVRFKDDLVDAKGDVLAKPPTASFRTLPVVTLIVPSGNGRVAPMTDIELSFGQPMDRAATEAAFKVTPALPGKLRWEDNRLVFTPDQGYLGESTHYTVSLATTALSSQNNPVLSEDFLQVFDTDELPDSASFGYGPHIQVVDAGGRRAIQFTILDNGLGQMEFTLHQLTKTQFLGRYADYSRSANGWDRTPIPLDDAPLIKEWIPTLAAARQDGSGRNINEVIIPADVPPGFYILNLVVGHINDQLFLVLTNRTVLVKQAEGDFVAWVTETNAGPAANVPVTFYTGNGQPIAQGLTDAEGIFRAKVMPDVQALLVMAGDEHDSTMTGLSNDWKSAGAWEPWWLPAPVGQNYGAYIYTDRPIYKPGQTLYYKAILRHDADAVLEVLPQGSLITMRIRDARNNIVQTQQLATNQFGTVNGKFDIAPGAMLGNYAVEVEVNGEVHKQLFKVQDYRKPDYEVKVSTNKHNYVTGADIQITVQAQYLYGEPVANAQVSLTQYEQSNTYCWDVCDGTPTWYQFGSHEIDGQTDANGRYTFSVKASSAEYNNYDYWWSNLTYSTLGLEVTVDDGSHQTVSNLTSIKVYDGAEQVRLETHGYLKTPNQPFDLALTATTVDDQPIGGQTYQLQIQQWDWATDGYKAVMPALGLTTDANGLSTTVLNLPKSGAYKLLVESQYALGNKIKVERWLYLMSDADRWTGTSSSVKISADQDTYKPGDTAALLIESPVSGPALLTFERGTTRREQLVELTAPLTRINLPIQPEDAPNIFVTLNQWIPQDTSLDALNYDDWGYMTLTQVDSRLTVASVELHVPVTNKSLTVTITPNKTTYAPREEATFTVRVTDFKGDPVSGEVSLALVDDAIFQLSDDLSGSIFNAFYQERDNLVRTYSTMAPSRFLPCECGGGGGGGMGPSNPRSDFPDTAAWAPALQTDWKGEATVTLTMPDTLTRWRLTAKATTADTQVGETTTTVTTYQPIVVRPLLPRTLTEGDQLELSTIVNNYSEQPQTLTIKLETGDLLTSTDPLTRTITLPAGGQTVLGWAATATRAGEASLMVSAKVSAINADEDYSDAVRLPLTIQPLAIPDVTTEVGEFSGTYESTLILPQGASDQSTVRIELSRSIAGSLMTGLEYLTGYPYGCVEQTMSKALPNAVVGRAFYQLGIGNPTLQADLPPKVNASLQRLYGYQHDDGGWGWWYDDNSDDYETAWVIYGLSMTADAGYEVDTGVIKRGADWLNGRLPQMDKRTEAFALYSLTLAGYGNREAAQALLPQADTLDAFSQAALALALYKQGQTNNARQVLALLEKAAVVQGDDVYWIASATDGHYHEKTMASTIRSTALALSALVAIKPGNQLQSGIVHYLMSQRQALGWGSTNETSFTIVALTDYLLAQPTTTADTAYTVELNGQTVATGTLGRGEPDITLEIPFQQLHLGGNRLRLTQAGGGQLYYVINNRVYVAQAQVEAAGKVKVTREYLDPKTNQAIVAPVAAGQLVQVNLTVEMPDDGFYMLVEDKLPGGFEALNEALNNSSHDGLAVASDYEFDAEPGWQQLGYNNKEVHGDHVSFFITELSGGRHVLTYFMRAVQPGTFAAMPTEVSAMYDSAIWGRSASGQVEVVEVEK